MANKIKKYSLKSVFLNFRKRISLRGIPVFIQKKPFTSFFLALILLTALIWTGSTIFKQIPLEERKPSQIKEVEVFRIGSSPKISSQALVEKSGVIKIVAQMPGIVSNIFVKEGDKVDRGKTLISLSSNYQGGNALTLSRQIAETQLALAKQNFETQKDLIEKQREVAERTDANQDELRNIANQSLAESRSLLDLNESLLSNLNQLSSQLEASTSADQNSQLISQTNAQRAQMQGVINQLKQGIRATEFQAASDKPPAQLSDLQREIALKNLDIQQKSLEANNQITALQFQLAQVSEAQMFPSAPFGATVERVHVKAFQAVNPGTPLLTISQNTDDVILDAKVPEQIAKNISTLEKSTVFVAGKTVDLTPFYISQEATDNQLFSVLFRLDDSYKQLFTDGSYVTVQIPIGSPDSNSIIPFIPIDAVFQTQEEAFVYVADGNVAKAKKIQLGNVQGNFVAVQEGIGDQDLIILSRNVVDGDQITVKN